MRVLRHYLVEKNLCNWYNTIHQCYVDGCYHEEFAKFRCGDNIFSDDFIDRVDFALWPQVCEVQDHGAYLFALEDDQVRLGHGENAGDEARKHVSGYEDCVFIGDQEENQYHKLSAH